MTFVWYKKKKKCIIRCLERKSNAAIYLSKMYEYTVFKTHCAGVLSSVEYINARLIFGYIFPEGWKRNSNT